MKTGPTIARGKSKQDYPTPWGHWGWKRYLSRKKPRGKKAKQRLKELRQGGGFRAVFKVAFNPIRRPVVVLHRQQPFEEK